MKKTNIYILLLFLGFWSCKNDDDNQSSTTFNGEIDWVKTLGGSYEDIAISITNTKDGNFLVFGTTASNDGDVIDKTSQENDYWLTKLNPEGGIIWTKTYGGTDDDVGQQVIELSDGSIAVVGYSRSSDGDASNNEGFHDNWILKLDSSGNLLWEKSFGFAGHDHAYNVVETFDGGFFMVGFLDVTASGGLGNSKEDQQRHGIGEFWCHRLDSDGNILWRNYYGGTNNDRAYGAVQADDGGFVITGFSESDDFDISNPLGSYDYWVIKIGPNGDLIWDKSLGGNEIDQSRAIIKTDDGNYLILGNSFSVEGNVTSNYGSSDVMITKIDDNGSLVWTKNFGGSDFDFGTSIRKTSTGYLVSGYSQSIDNDLESNYGGNDFWIFKINPSGNLIWQKNFGGSSLDFCHDAIETLNGDIIAVGETESNDFDILENKGLKDALIIKIQ